MREQLIDTANTRRSANVVSTLAERLVFAGDVFLCDMVCTRPMMDNNPAVLLT